MISLEIQGHINTIIYFQQSSSSFFLTLSLLNRQGNETLLNLVLKMAVKEKETDSESCITTSSSCESSELYFKLVNNSLSRVILLMIAKPEDSF